MRIGLRDKKWRSGTFVRKPWEQQDTWDVGQVVRWEGCWYLERLHIWLQQRVSLMSRRTKSCHKEPSN